MSSNFFSVNKRCLLIFLTSTKSIFNILGNVVWINFRGEDSGLFHQSLPIFTLCTGLFHVPAISDAPFPPQKCPPVSTASVDRLAIRLRPLFQCRRILPVHLEEDDLCIFRCRRNSVAARCPAGGQLYVLRAIEVVSASLHRASCAYPARGKHKSLWWLDTENTIMLASSHAVCAKIPFVTNCETGLDWPREEPIIEVLNSIQFI